MLDTPTSREIARISCLCIIWFLCSSANGVIGKTILTDFPYPMTLVMCQLMAVTVMSRPVFVLFRVRITSEVPWHYFLTMIVPLALGKFLATLTSQISIWRVPVSYAHTVKATMPLFTVVLSRIILRQVQTTKVYLSLLPIMLGVLIATASELSFDGIGLVSALAATAGFSLMHIFSKKAMQEKKLHHLWLLYTLAKMATILFIPVWIIFDLQKILNHKHLLDNTDPFVLGFLLCLDGLLNFVQNIVAFTLLSMVSPLSYSVCNACKRMVVVLVSLLFLQNPVTPTNVCGMLFAISGVLYYNKAKYDSMKEMKSVPMLPVSLKSNNNILLGLENGSRSYFLLSADSELRGYPDESQPRQI